MVYGCYFPHLGRYAGHWKGIAYEVRKNVRFLTCIIAASTTPIDFRGHFATGSAREIGTFPEAGLLFYFVSRYPKQLETST
jgi:hypothetical protein